MEYGTYKIKFENLLPIFWLLGGFCNIKKKLRVSDETRRIGKTVAERQLCWRNWNIIQWFLAIQYRSVITE